MAGELAWKKAGEVVDRPNYELSGSDNHILEEAENFSWPLSTKKRGKLIFEETASFWHYRYL